VDIWALGCTLYYIIHKKDPFDGKDPAEIKKKIPARRLGLPEDIANAVLFFAQESSSYVTGQILKVDGGLTLGGI